MLTGKRLPAQQKNSSTVQTTGCTRMYFETDELYARWYPWVSHVVDENSAARTVVFTKQSACDSTIDQMRRMRGRTVEYDTTVGLWRVQNA